MTTDRVRTSPDPADKIAEHRETLEELAARDDLRVSKYAEALLEAARED